MENFTWGILILSVINRDAELYDWELENCKLRARECWTNHAIPKKKTQQCFSIITNPKIFEHKIREYPSPTPVDNVPSCRPPLRYKERESPAVHVEQVSKNIREQG